MPANNTNAYTLWKAGAIAATNVDFHCNLLETSSAAFKAESLNAAFISNANSSRAPILTNVAVKDGFNAIRTFMPLQEYKIGAQPDNGTVLGAPIVEHDITTIARVGWDDNLVVRNRHVDPGQNVTTLDLDTAPRYRTLAAQLDNLLQICSQTGMGLILSVGTFYSNDTGGRLWTETGLQQDLVTFWSKTAQKWHGQAGLIAYELINEPSPPGLYAAMRSGTNSFKGLMERCINAIRAYDTVTPIIVSGPRGSSIDALDFFFDTTSTHGANLVSDPNNKLVYTAHLYTPSDFCQQGIGAGTYHRLGTRYLNTIGVRQGYASDGSQSSTVVRDYNTTGMSDDFQTISTFKTNYGVPVFLGEFSSSSSSYYQRVVNGPSGGEGLGALRTSTPDSADRAIYNLFYCPNKSTGYIVLRAPIGLLDRTETDPNAATSGFSTKWPVNRVQVEIKANGGANIGPFANLVVSGVLCAYRRWTNGGGVWNQDNEFMISFPWPTATSAAPATYQAYGDQLFYNSWTDANNQKVEITQHLVDSAGNAIDPSGFRSAFENFDNGHGMKKGTDVDGQGHPLYLPLPTQIASLRILLSPTQIANQEADRVKHANDVLRQCATRGLSWAWFCETDFKDPILWGDKFWTVDSQGTTNTGAGGNLRAALKRATNQSIA